ncbi:MAG: dihydrofolate reductase family protein, partial [Candidatus Zixiibacteriota bacterium]
AAPAKTIRRFVLWKRWPGLICWEIGHNGSGRLDLADLLQKAGAFGFQSILVEGGSALATSLLRAGLVDKMVLVLAPKIVGEGTASIGDLGIRKLAESIRLEVESVERLGPDTIVVGYPNFRR